MFLKVCNVDKFFKSSSREFHSLMEDGIHDFVRYKFYLRALRYFCYFSGGNLKFY